MLSMHLEPHLRRRVVYFGILIEASLAAIAWFVGWVIGIPLLGRLSWNEGDALLGVAATLPMLGFFIACVRWPVGPLARIKEFMHEVVRPLFASSSMMEVALISLAAGVGEELLFRGLLQELFISWFGVWLGVVATAVLFGLAHPITWTYAVITGLLGIYLGWLALATENLLVVIVAHALYDFVALVWLIKQRPGKLPAS